MNASHRVTIIADGDVALRLYKRVACAAHALGLELVVEEKHGHGETPRVFIEGALLFEGLQRTEFIESRLADWHTADALKEKHMHHPIRVLFVCDGGSVRSRMAEGLLRAADSERFEVHSAGIETEALNPLAVEVMREMDIEISNEPIAALNDFEDVQFDYVISLCDEAKSSCLAFARDGHNLHWTCPDPSAVKGDVEQIRAAFRQARDALRRHVQTWLTSLRQT